jgi:hypothetical protein
MQKLIVWFTAVDKKIKFNQFHVEATGVTEAINLLNENKTFDLKVMGVGSFQKRESDVFTNLKFY